MGYKIVINGEDVDPAEVSGYISTYKHNVIEKTITKSDHGNDPAVCSGWSTNIIEILGIASVIFFAIPTATKKIRDTCKEWGNVYDDLNEFFNWISKEYDIYSYSIDVVFLDALKHLESQTEIMDLTLVHHIELPKTRYKEESNFDYTTTGMYYQFVFENKETGHIYLLLYNSQKDLLIDGDLGMYLGQNNEIKTINK